MKLLTPVSAVSARFYWVSADTGEESLLEYIPVFGYVSVVVVRVAKKTKSKLKFHSPET